MSTKLLFAHIYHRTIYIYVFLRIHSLRRISICIYCFEQTKRSKIVLDEIIYYSNDMLFLFGVFL